jgi:hypothetical protein
MALQLVDLEIVGINRSLTPCGRLFFEFLTVSQPVKKFFAYIWNRETVTAFIRAVTSSNLQPEARVPSSFPTILSLSIKFVERFG